MSEVLFYLIECSKCKRKRRAIRDVGIDPSDMDHSCGHCGGQLNEVEVSEKVFDAAKK